jgi:hypothetical protein
MVAHRFQFRAGIVEHPLRQRLAFDVFGHDIEIVAFARLRTGFQHLRTIDPPRDPLFQNESLQIGPVVAKIDGRGLDDDQRAAVDILGEIDMAAAAAVHLANDPVAIERSFPVRAAAAAAVPPSCC